MFLRKAFVITLILGCGFWCPVYGAQCESQPQARTGCCYLQKLKNSPFFLRASQGVNSGLNFCKTYPATVGLMAANLGIFAAQNYYQLKAKTPVLEMKFGLVDSAVKQGEWWRLFTSMFLHADYLHVAMNNFGLLNMRTIEKVIGWKKFLSFYAVSGILANIASYGIGKSEEFSLGASGAIYGLLGAYYGLAIKRNVVTHSDFARDVAQSVGLTFVLSRLLGGNKVDHVARIGGLASGYALGQVFSD